MQQHPDFHITSSTILTSTLHITRLNTPGPIRIDAAAGSRTLGLRPNFDVPVPSNIRAEGSGRTEHLGEANQQDENIRGNPLPMPDQPEAGQSPSNMNSFSSLLLWILGGASSESLNSIFSVFRDMRDQGQFYTEPPNPRRETNVGQHQQQPTPAAAAPLPPPSGVDTIEPRLGEI